MNSDLTIAFNKAADERSDFQGHVRTVQKLAAQCDHITEFGIRYGVSSVGLLAGLPNFYIGYDKGEQLGYEHLESLADSNRIDCLIRREDTLSCDVIEDTDLLLIDTLHTYAQLSAELTRHAGQVRRFIVMHDTKTFGNRDQGGDGPGLWQAIDEFVDANVFDWGILRVWQNSNGLVVLAKHGIIAPEFGNNSGAGVRQNGTEQSNERN